MFCRQAMLPDQAAAMNSKNETRSIPQLSNMPFGYQSLAARDGTRVEPRRQDLVGKRGARRKSTRVIYDDEQRSYRAKSCLPFGFRAAPGSSFVATPVQCPALRASSLRAGIRAALATRPTGVPPRSARNCFSLKVRQGKSRSISLSLPSCSPCETAGTRACATVTIKRRSALPTTGTQLGHSRSVASQIACGDGNCARQRRSEFQSVQCGQCTRGALKSWMIGIPEAIGLGKSTIQEQSC